MIHEPVMKDEILSISEERSSSGTFIDCTVGEGGHTAFLMDAHPEWSFYGFERDDDIFAAVSARFGERSKIFHDSYANILEHFESVSAALLFDLGVSMYHFKTPGRGFSFNDDDDDLDMRFSRSTPMTAADILNGYGAEELRKMLERYAEMMHPEPLVEAIMRFRKKRVFLKVMDIKECLSFMHRRGKTHPLTTVFQALRIETNGELHELEKICTLLLERTASFSGSLFMFISYHSLEDRTVKSAVRELVARGHAEAVNKKVIKPHWKEVSSNKASRSGRLRAFNIL